MQSRRPAARERQEAGEHGREDDHRQQRVRDRGDDQDPGREARLRQQEPLGVQGGDADSGAFGEELPDEQADDEIEAVGLVRDENE